MADDTGRVDRSVAARDALVAGYPILGELSPGLRRDVEGQRTRVEVPPHHRIFNDGDAATVFGLLLVGRVRVALIGPTALKCSSIGSAQARPVP